MDPVQLGAIVAALFGSVVGSFLNVVIYRLPLGRSIAFPASQCPRCGSPVRFYDNIPVLSYLLLRGRCRNCAGRISPRYPLVEALVGGVAALLWLRDGPTAAFAVHFLFVAGLVAITFIDIDHHIIPDSLSYGGIAVGVAASFFLPPGWQDSLLGVALGAGSLLAVAGGYYLLTRREGMGLGDVKLLGAIGAFLGWQAVLFTIFVSSVVGAVVGLVCVALKNAGLRLEIPYGPFLALGAVLHLFWGPELIEWYLGFAFP